MCCRKQRRCARAKSRNFLKFGTFKKTALSATINRKGPWHLSRTPAGRMGVPDKGLKGYPAVVACYQAWGVFSKKINKFVNNIPARHVCAIECPNRCLKCNELLNYIK